MSRFALSALGLTVLLTGCLDKMEKTTDATKDAVLRSVAVIDDTHLDQKLGGALELLPDDIAIKSAAAETMFIMAKEDRIYKYIGCTMPLNYPMGMNSALPNVSFIGTKTDSVKNIGPISPEKYEILELATMRVLRELVLKSQTQLTKEELADVKAKAKRMFYVASALLGAQPGPVRERADEERIRAVLENQKANQAEAAEKMMALTTLFVDPGDDKEMKFKVERLIETRFDHNFERTNPAGTL